MSKKKKSSGRPHQSFYAKHEAVILGGLSIVLIIGVWQAFWSAGMISPLFFSSPSAIVKQFRYTLVEGTLLSDMKYSGTNFAIGFVLAVITGVIAGVLIWSKVFIVFLSAFFPILVNTVGGVRALDRDLLRAAKAYCASDWQIFTTLAIPGSVPFILTGIRQGVALGLIGIVVGEMVGSSQGVGFMVAYGGQTFNTDTLFVGMIVIAFSGILLTWLAERLERRFSRWRPER